MSEQDLSTEHKVNETQTNDDLPGVLTTLANLPEKALLDESAMARAFKVSPRTIRRMVTRFELPPSIRVAGRSVWIVGRVLAYLEDTAEQAEKEAKRNIARLRQMGT